MFRGALKATNPTSNDAFYLDSAYQPQGFAAGALNLRTVLHNGVGGTLTWRLNDFAVTVSEDGFGSSYGANAKALTSLDGVSFDQHVVQTPAIAMANDWQG